MKVTPCVRTIGRRIGLAERLLLTIAGRLTQGIAGSHWPAGRLAGAYSRESEAAAAFGLGSAAATGLDLGAVGLDGSRVLTSRSSSLSVVRMKRVSPLKAS